MFINSRNPLVSRGTRCKEGELAKESVLGLFAQGALTAQCVRSKQNQEAKVNTAPLVTVSWFSLH